MSALMQHCYKGEAYRLDTSGAIHLSIIAYSDESITRRLVFKWFFSEKKTVDSPQLSAARVPRCRHIMVRMDPSAQNAKKQTALSMKMPTMHLATGRITGNEI